MSTVEWVEIIEPRTKEHMFANLCTGECVWEPPVGVPVKKTDDNQWWELFDQNTSRFYYYNATSQKTVWHRPTNCDIIPLAKLQTLKQNTEPKNRNSLSKKSDDRRSSKDEISQTTSGSKLSKLSPTSSGPVRTSILSMVGSQTSPTSSPRLHSRSKHSRQRAHTTSSGGPGGRHQGGGHRKGSSRHPPNGGDGDQVSLGSIHSDISGSSSIKYNGAKRAGHPMDRRSLDGGGGAKHCINNNGSINSINSIKYYSMPVKDGSINISNTSLTKINSSGRFSNKDVVSPPPGYAASSSSLSKQRSLEGDNFKILQSPTSTGANQDGSLSRSISFMTRNDHNGDGGHSHDNGRRSVESTPQSGRRYPLMSPEYSDHPALRPAHRGHPTGHSRTSSISSMGGHGGLDGFPTPLINRRTGGGGHEVSHHHHGGRPHQTSESEDSAQSPAKERRSGGHGPSSSHGGHGLLSNGAGGRQQKSFISDLVDSGLSTLTETENHRSNVSLNQRDLGVGSQQSLHKKPSHSHHMKERSLTSLSLQVKKPKLRTSRTNVKEGSSKEGSKIQAGDHLDKSPSLQKISPLQHYILEQAKLSGYRFGDKIPSEKRDSFIDSENESHRTGDDSDAFADDEAPSSDGGMEERDDISLISTVSSVGEDDNYLSEPTYNNLDPVWAQRHGFGPGIDTSSTLDIDAFSEEFDLRMRWGRGGGGTIPRPTSHGPPPPHPPPPRPGSAVQPPHHHHHQHRDHVDTGHHHRHSDIMNTSQLSDKTGSTLSVSASIHSTLSAGTLTDFENFAASNLNIQKKGLFRKKMSLKDVLSWQEESISKPLTFVNEKNQKKEAVAVFKLVQIYMSDRKAKVGMTINSVAQDISETGYTTAGLRDEIYIQLCKQVSDNPRRESLRRGWELLAICLAFFPPSPTFYPYLLGFIQKHRDPNMDFPEVGRWPLHVQISHYAGICNKRLERIGVGGRLGPKKPTLEDIDQSRLQIFRPSMFGGTLMETLNIQKDKFPNRRLPWILTTLTEQILALNGLTTEGIFRIPADFDEVMSVKTRYDQWEPGACSDAHVPAALLKQWLRELYIPLIPDDTFYNESIRVCEDAEAACGLVQRLPELHQVVLSYLIKFLQLFTRQEVVMVTKMDASNLSMVFAPNFLRCPSKDPVIIMENTRKEMAFVKTLIHHLDTSAVDGIS